MNRDIVVAAFVIAFGASTAHAQAMKDMPMGKSSEAVKSKSDPGKQAATHDGVGLVKNVDTAKGTVTLEHEAIPTIPWRAMTMTFAAADKKLLQGVKPGEKVHFQLKESPSKAGTYVVTSIKP